MKKVQAETKADEYGFTEGNHKNKGMFHIYDF